MRLLEDHFWIGKSETKCVKGYSWFCLLAETLLYSASPIDIGWLVVLGLTALWDIRSVYIGPSPREEKETRNDRREKKKSIQPHPHLLQAQ